MNRLTKIFCLLTALVLCMSASSCAIKKAVSFGSQILSRKQFLYALTLTKTQTLSTILGTTASLTDDPSYWTTSFEDGSTYADVVRDTTLKTVKMTLFYADYATKQGLSLSDTQKEAAQQQVDKIVSSFQSRKEFDSYMKKYGFDYNFLLSYYELDELSSLGMRAYYNAPETSLMPADVQIHYEENYVSCTFLYVNETDRLLSNGKRVPLGEEEKRERADYFEAAKAALTQGGDFAEWMQRADAFSSEDGKTKTFLLDTVTPSALQHALKGAEDGELFVVEDDKGRYLVRRDELDYDYYEEISEALLLNLVNMREKEILQEHSDQFLLDQEYLSSIDISTLPIF